MTTRPVAAMNEAVARQIATEHSAQEIAVMLADEILDRGGWRANTCKPLLRAYEIRAASAAPSGEQRKEGQRVGICGNRSPSAFGTSEVCTLPHGHGGWHEADADLGLSPMRWSSFGGVQHPGSDRVIRMPGVLGGDDDAGEAQEWWTRNRALALCKRYGHAWEAYNGAEMNGPYRECARCGEMAR